MNQSSKSDKSQKAHITKMSVQSTRPDYSCRQQIDISGFRTNKLSGSPIRVPPFAAALGRERSDRSGAAAKGGGAACRPLRSAAAAAARATPTGCRPCTGAPSPSPSRNAGAPRPARSAASGGRTAAPRHPVPTVRAPAHRHRVPGVPELERAHGAAGHRRPSRPASLAPHFPNPKPSIHNPRRTDTNQTISQNENCWHLGASGVKSCSAAGRSLY